MEDRSQLTRFAWLSIGAAVTTITLKVIAYFITGSVGLLSDAAESGVNLVAAIVALIVLTVAARPPDEEHAYGHSKAEYFSSGVEGTLIFIAALSISYAAVIRLIQPQPIEQVGIGLGFSTCASLINLAVALVLRRAGKKYDSISLDADSQHLLTDVWTSVGVIIGVGAVALTGWEWLDPLVALAVAVNIVWTGFQLVRRSVLGLLDTALADEDLRKIETILAQYKTHGIVFHAMRTRQAGARGFMSLHVLVPGEWTVQRGHELLEKIEGDIRSAVPHLTVFTHIEPLGDPASWNDTSIDRDPAKAETPSS